MKRFLIIPGLPRCATTSLAALLGQHPDIFLPKIKESHFFLPNKEQYFMFNSKGNKVDFSKTGFLSTQHEFETNYEGFKDDRINIDGSTLYCVHLEALANLKSMTDIDPYFIILKKDPFKRAMSHYLYSVSRGEEFRDFETAILDEAGGKYPKWLLGGYLAGSHHKYCEQYIIDNWGSSRLITGDIDTDKVFSEEYVANILKFLNLESISLDVSVKANSLTPINNPFFRQMRILIKRIRQVNPQIFDNKLSRGLFNVFMKLVPKDKDATQKLKRYRDFYMEHYNNYKPQPGFSNASTSLNNI